MRFGFIAPNNWGLDDPHTVIEIAVEAEAAGIDSIWVNHHLVNVGYIGDRLGSRPYYDALTVLTWIAANTSTITVGTSVLVVPYLHPASTAKALATLDQLSRGRLIAGLGVGSLPEENDVLGVPYDGRGPWSDEFIEVMRALWASGEASHAGENWAFEQVPVAPKPRQDPLPVWIGGGGRAACRRAARFGQGWHPLSTLDGFRQRVPTMLDALRTEDKAREGFVLAPRIELSELPDVEAARSWAEAGADELVVATASADPVAIRDGLAQVAEIAQKANLG